MKGAWLAPARAAQCPTTQPASAQAARNGSPEPHSSRSRARRDERASPFSESESVSVSRLYRISRIHSLALALARSLAGRQDARGPRRTGRDGSRRFQARRGRGQSLFQERRRCKVRLTLYRCRVKVLMKFAPGVLLLVQVTSSDALLLPAPFRAQCRSRVPPPGPTIPLSLPLGASPHPALRAPEDGRDALVGVCLETMAGMSRLPFYL